RRFQRRFSLTRRVGIFGAILIRHRQIKVRIVEALAQILEAAELCFDSVLFFQQRLRRLGLIPKAGLGRFFQQFLLAGG
ncbi:MAG: hypothetical protein ABSG46_04645, partial [Candidatus Binataceae bacterium]